MASKEQLSDAVAATNYQMSDSGPFITDRTTHVIREVDGHCVVTGCGYEFRPEAHALYTDVAQTDERHRCGRCYWDRLLAEE